MATVDQLERLLRHAALEVPRPVDLDDLAPVELGRDQEDQGTDRRMRAEHDPAAGGEHGLRHGRDGLRDRVRIVGTEPFAALAAREAGRPDAGGGARKGE